MRLSVAELLDGTIRCDGCRATLYLPPPSAILDALVAPDMPASWARLSGRERELAVVLLACAGQMVERDALVAAAWGPGYDAHSLRMAMVRLRRKLVGSGWSIETTTSVGYRLVPPAVDRLTALREMEEAAHDPLAA